MLNQNVTGGARNSPLLTAIKSELGQGSCGLQDVLTPIVFKKQENSLTSFGCPSEDQNRKSIKSIKIGQDMKVVQQDELNARQTE